MNFPKKIQRLLLLLHSETFYKISSQFKISIATKFMSSFIISNVCEMMSIFLHYLHVVLYVTCLIVNDQFYACLLHEIFSCPPPQSKKQNKKSSIFVKKSYVSEWVGYFMMRLCVWIFLILAKKGMPKNHENFKQVVLLLQ